MATLVTKMSFKCKLCGCDDFYITPEEEQIASGDYVFKENSYKVICKACKQVYIFDFRISAYIREKK